MPRAALPLRLKLSLLAIILATIPLAIVGYSLINVNKESLERVHEELLFAVIDDVATSLASTTSDAEDLLNAVARALEDDSVAMSTRLGLAKSLVGGSGAIERVLIYDAKGALIDAITKKGTAAKRDKPPTLSAKLRAAADKTRMALGDIEVSATGARLRMVVPIRGKAATWYASSSVPLTAMQQRTQKIAEQRFTGKRAVLFVVDSKLRAVAHSDPEIAAGSPLAGEGVLNRLEGGAIDKGLIVFGSFKDARGTKMVAGLRSLPTYKLAIVAQLPHDVAYASLVRMRNIVITVVGAVLLLALVLGVIVARRITAPIAQLVAFSQELADRRFDQRIEVRTRDELAVLASAMSGAAENLQASEQRIREEIEIRTDLRRYLPDQLVDKVVERKQPMALGGERRNITVLFADVAGFTPLAEKRGAEEVVTILNELFTILTEIVFRHDGIVDKFMGDSVMAIWGAPKVQSEHAKLAVEAAEDMMRWLETANDSWQSKYDMTIQLAIGVHTGEAVVGNFGSSTRMEYTAIGDTVNVAARLEAIARPGQILTTNATKQAAGKGFEFRPVGSKNLAGREAVIELWEVAV